MNIGIDIDGVLIDQREFLIEKGTIFFKRKPINESTLDLKEMFGCSKKDETKFWTRYLIEYSTKVPARAWASKAIKKLHHKNKVFIITSRTHSTKENLAGIVTRFGVKKWLENNKIEYDELIFCDEDKMDAINRHNITVMVEDNVENIKTMSEKIEVVAFVDKHNEKGLYELKDNYSSIHPLFDWDSINLFLQKLADKYNAPYNGEKLKDKPSMKYYPLYQTLGDVKEEKMYDFMFARNKYHMNAVALKFFGRNYTYKEMKEKIDECANAFVSLGVKKGDIVSLCIPNTPEAIFAFYALNKMGVVANMIHPLKSENEIRDYVNETESNILVVIDNSFEKVNNVINQTNLSKVVVASAADSMPLAMSLIYRSSLKKDNKFYQGNVDEKFISWNEFMKSGKGYKHEKAPYQSNECAVLLHTGGTSGKSKAVMQSDHSFNSMVAQFWRNVDNFERGDTLLAIMPIFHGFGLCSSIHLPLSCSVGIALIPKLNPKEMDKLLTKYDINHVIGVPTLTRAFKNNPKIQKMDLSSIKNYVVGGDGTNRVEEEENREFLKSHNAQAEYSKGYGLTECVAGVTFAFGENNKIGSSGIPSVFTDFIIVEPDGEKVLEPYEVGEVCVSGPTNMLGYYKDLKATKNVLRIHSDGKVWLHTGDLGYLDEDGIFFYKQRVDRMFVSSGVNVYPQVVETIVSEIPYVDKCVMVAMEDEYKGAVGKLYVVLKQEYKNRNDLPLDIQLNKVLKENLDRYHQPAVIEYIDTIPETNIGKVDYKALQVKNNEKTKSYIMREG